MGFTYVEGRAQGRDGGETTVNFLVDSGSGYTLLPYQVWQSLGAEPTRKENLSWRMEWWSPAVCQLPSGTATGSGLFAGNTRRIRRQPSPFGPGPSRNYGAYVKPVQLHHSLDAIAMAGLVSGI